MNFKIHKRILCIMFVAIFFPFFAFASEIRIETSKVNVGTKEQFVADVILYASEDVNSVGGELVFSEDALKIKEIRDGDSSLNFWIERPNNNLAGRVAFSGITPGGFRGVQKKLFSVVFESEKIGVTNLSMENIMVLKNDGLGTRSEVAIKDAVINVEKGDIKIIEKIMDDVDPPESFTPIITQDPAIFNNMWFVVFSTQDKNSGISHYEIKEYRYSFLKFLSPWKKIENPYQLSDQNLKSFVVIKSFDNSGNERIEKVIPINKLKWYESGLYWIIIIVGFGFLLRTSLLLWKRSDTH